MTDVPMTRPEEMLAMHQFPYGHSTTWVDLGDGRVLLSATGQFQSSEDGGLTWSEPFTGKDQNDKDVASSGSLVRLNSGGIGMASQASNSDRRADSYIAFRRSQDEGRTWSQPVKMNRLWPAFAYQDVLLRTSSGRILLPVYCGVGQGTARAVGAPFPGGFLNGEFISTDAHYADGHFAFSFVLYSDDDGQTWNESEGELIIKMTYDGNYEYAAEPSVAEVSPGKLTMVVRNRLGRLFQAFSEDDGHSWSSLQPTALATSTAPAQIRRVAANGHLLVVWNQEGERDIRRGLVRTRISSAVSRNGGGVWEYHQNIESILEGALVEPGPIRPTFPEAMFEDAGEPARQRDGSVIEPLPPNMGRWSYPSVLVMQDRVLVAHTYRVYANPDRFPAGTARIKVLPLSWFYGGADPLAPSTQRNAVLEKVWKAANP